MNKRIPIREVVRNMGRRNIIASSVVFLLTVAVTFAGGYRLYVSVKQGINLQGRVNAVQSAKEFDSYLLVRKNTVILAGHVVDEMIRENQPNSEILEYLTAESLSIKKSIDKDYTGLYGWINGEYLDGDGWVPDEDYVPTERPWYTETVADDSEVTFVRPYLDDQTKTVLTTMAKQLSDGVNVIALDVTLGHIQDITVEIAESTPGSYGLVLDKTGKVIAHSNVDELGKNYHDEIDTLGSVLLEELEKDDDNEFQLSFNGESYMVFVEPIEGDWRSISMLNTRVFYRPLIIILSLMGLFTILEAVVFIEISRYQSDKNIAIATAEAAQSANRAKSQFLSRMSHEIRTPINAIIGLDSIALRDESISEHTRDELNKIGSSAKHLLSIVNDILDMNRIESGKIALKEEVFSFPDLLEQINIIVGGQCDEKGLSYKCQKLNDTDEYFFGDHLKLKQIIINILGNSVKFTDAPGEISFMVEQNAGSADKASLHFTMKDTGIGMDRDYLPKLFDAFSQEDNANTSKYGGSGLGMAITKSFIDMMGGQITVESEKGIGSTFTVTIPLTRVKEEDKPKDIEEESSRNAPLENIHVLIAEDQEINAEVLSDLLDLEGVSSEWAKNGKEAVELFNENEEGYFAAILMDMRMPVMDGLEATRQIRKLERKDATDIPIVALSANAFEEDVRHCLEAGMNAHLSKPVDINKLKEVLGDLLDPQK
ncbi:MAG: response regulator [Erysipelotrichaceae bacterium]|nr:response regulator [Erysipelotrichaceae bacterium]